MEKSIYYKEVDGFSTVNQFVTLHVDAVAKTLRPMNKDLLTFRTNEYPTLCRDLSILGNVINPVNLFFSSLSLEDQSAIAQTLGLLHLILTSTPEVPSKFQSSLTECGNIILALDKEINLCDKLFEYTSNNIPVDDMTESGNRPQDTADMTFTREEIIAFTSMGLMCKLFFPITGLLLLMSKRLSVAGFREADCASIYTPILNKNWNFLMTRLEFYANSLVSKRIHDDSVSAFHGLTLSTVVMRTKANVFIKKFVTENIYNGNVAKYITACIRTGTTSQYENAKTRQNVQFRQDPSDKASEEGNTSKMESESKPSKHSADFPIILRHQTQRIWGEYINRYELDENVILQAKSFYDVNLLAPTSLSMYILTNFFGEAFGGGKSMQYIKMDTHTYMVATLQHIMLKLGSPSLIHALSMVPSSRLKTKIPDGQKMFSHTWSSTSEFKRCKQQFAVGFGEKTWDSKLSSIVDELVKYVFLHNTAPVFWEMLDRKNNNGTTIHDYGNMIKDTCKLLYMIHTEGDLC